MISSMSNQQMKNLIQLQKKAKTRNEQNCYIVEGIKMYEEIPKEQFVKAYVSESFYKETTKNNRQYFERKEVEIVADNVFKEISDTMTPQGVMAVVKQNHFQSNEIMAEHSANLIILEDVRDPGNLGTIIRTAEGAGITGIVLSRSCVDIYNPKVIRSTMGSIYRMPFVYVEDLAEAIKEMKENHITLYAAHLLGVNNYDKEDYISKCGILIGNEAQGLSDEISALADYFIKIPMCGKVESLNAAISAAILMYEIYRQRR